MRTEHDIAYKILEFSKLEDNWSVMHEGIKFTEEVLANALIMATMLLPKSEWIEVFPCTDGDIQIQGSWKGSIPFKTHNYCFRVVDEQ